MKHSKFKYLIIGIIIMLITFSLKIFNDYREKDLVDVIKYKPSDFRSLGVIRDLNNVGEDKAYELFVEEKEPVEELLEFLAPYRVQKISEEEFNRSLHIKDRFEFTISHSKSKPTMVRIRDNNVHVLVGNYYEVVNGEMDMDWLEAYVKKYKKVYSK